MSAVDEKIGAMVLELREQIPQVECIEGCHDCCGPAPCTHWERERMGAPPDPAQGRDDAQPGSCRWLGPSGCTVYEERPMVCRLYGVVEGLACPHQCRPTKGARLAQGAQARIITRYSLAVFMDQLEHMTCVPGEVQR
ncbi:MAG TPA: YkgJ family cysteine cluster protein [Armatimonadota bacterium]|nr:YkgJ family cysteine cluster protein [Armatimonadota bacterium]